MLPNKRTAFVLGLLYQMQRSERWRAERIIRGPTHERHHDAGGDQKNHRILQPDFITMPVFHHSSPLA